MDTTGKHAVVKFILLHKEATDGQRPGQRFCNMYLTAGVSWPELYYERNEEKAFLMIQQWLNDNHYITELPPQQGA